MFGMLDWELFTKLTGYSNKNSAQSSFHKIKHKLLDMIPDEIATESAEKLAVERAIRDAMTPPPSNPVSQEDAPDAVNLQRFKATEFARHLARIRRMRRDEPDDEEECFDEMGNMLPKGEFGNPEFVQEQHRLLRVTPSSVTPLPQYYKRGQEETTLSTVPSRRKMTATSLPKPNRIAKPKISKRASFAKKLAAYAAAAAAVQKARVKLAAKKQAEPKPLRKTTSPVLAIDTKEEMRDESTLSANAIGSGEAQRRQFVVHAEGDDGGSDDDLY